MVCYVLSAVQLRQARRKGGCLLGERCQQCHACSVQRTPEGSSAADVAFLGIVAQHKAFDVTNLFCLLLSSLISSGFVKHLFRGTCSSSYDAMLCVTATGIPQACDIWDSRSLFRDFFCLSQYPASALPYDGESEDSSRAQKDMCNVVQRPGRFCLHLCPSPSLQGLDQALLTST